VARSRTAAAQLTPGKIQYLVRVLARESRDGREARTTEYMCDMLYGVATGFGKRNCDS